MPDPDLQVNHRPAVGSVHHLELWVPSPKETTMTAPAENHARTAENFARLVDGVTRWDVPTPVSEWLARDIVEHLLTWPVSLLAERIGLVLGDQPDAPLAECWARRSAEVQRTLDDRELAATPVHSGMFDGVPLGELVDRIYTADVFLHSWDLARATGQEPGLDPGRAAAMLTGMSQMEDAIRSSGQYGPAVETSSTDPVDRLMAFIGRDPAWTPPPA